MAQAPAQTEDKRLAGSKGQEERKRRVLNKGRSSITHSIAGAIVTKSGDLFFLSQPDGQVPLDGNHGLGLYHHDCRFLHGYELKLAGEHPSALTASAAAGYKAVVELTNEDIRQADGKLIPKEDLGIKWERAVDADGKLYDVISFQNFGLDEVRFPVSLSFSADFESIFAVRGRTQEKKGEMLPPSWEDGSLRLMYKGADKRDRSLRIAFNPKPNGVKGTEAEFVVQIGPRRNWKLRVSLSVEEVDESSRPDEAGGKTTATSPRKAGSDKRVAAHTRVSSDSILLNGVLERSLGDLQLLSSELEGERFFAAGIPWYGTLFGRDSLITSLETLAFDSEVAADTLRLLAKYQGQRIDDWRDEQPGKILHELRFGELARLNIIPQTPYYGSIDSTLLFLILVGKQAEWTGDLGLFHELKGNVERALQWMDEYADLDGDGYVRYKKNSEKGLDNQGWKDSGDAIVNDDGSLAAPPIALVEVQGYSYMARLVVANLYRRSGDSSTADRLEQKAREHRERFNRDFWMEDKEFYALALQRGNEPVRVISSNPGQALWAGIVDADKAEKTSRRLFDEDMFSGWGIRTLSSSEKRYNPIGYHLGTVWPHDNALIAAGLRRYGFDNLALKVFQGIVEAAMHFENYRLPEVFSGLKKSDYSVPVRYPVACHPQAWAAASVPFLIESLLGLVPDAFEKKLTIVRPILPDFVGNIELHGIRVGKATADLAFHRVSHGVVAVRVVRLDGELDISVDLGPEKRPRR